MNNILLSVVIPTYNRYEYLKSCIETIAAIDTQELEVVVHDNTEDNSEILPFIKALNDIRIKYYHVKEHISVVDNSDRGVSYATGEYVCMIGDDDTICESMIDAARFCRENNVDACMAIIPGYNWPDMTFVDKIEANLFYSIKADGSVKIIDEKKYLMNAITKAVGLSDFMPRIYHGMVSKKCLDKVKEICGTYFPGPSPDMANATAVSLVSNRTIFLSDYLMVSGYGYKSARGEGNRKAHYGKISEKPWLPRDTEATWETEIPKIFSGETIFAQSLLRALHLMKRDDLAEKYDYGCLYARFFAHHPAARSYMLVFLLKRPYRLLWMIGGIVKRLRIRQAYLKEKKDNYVEVENIHTLKEAQRYTMKLREEGKLSKYFWLENG